MPSRCRSAPKRCTRWRRKASRRTGSTRTVRCRRATSSGWPGCGRWWSGSATSKNSDEFLSTLKIDLYPEEVYTFTPKGKIVILPRDATPIDFAYTVHTEVGHTCVGAKVNGRIVPLRYKLRSGDIVEILTQPGHHPSRDWLQLAKSPRARQKIKHWLNVHQRERAIEIGRKLIEKEARKYRIAMKEHQRSGTDAGGQRKRPGQARRPAGRHRLRQVLRAQHPGAAGSRRADSRAYPDAGAAEKDADGRIHQRRAARLRRRRRAIKVKGHDDLLVYRARCCNPIRGEEIVGYVTRGKGVAVHSKSCPNVDNLMYEPERRIAVEWGTEGKISAETPGRPAIRSSWRCSAITVPAC